MAQETNRDLLEILKWSTYRWLNHVQLNPDSKLYGCADREFWAWKTKDFANGTWQAGISGFLDCRSTLPLSDSEVTAVCSAVIRGTRRIQRSNGSFEEAYPFESSYAVTGLLLFEFMHAKLRHPRFFDEAQSDFRTVTDSAYKFLIKTQESHGVIANHVCTTICALEMYEYAKSPSGWIPSDRFWGFIKLQDPNEHWFPEYGGPDPGYQTLLNSYLIRFMETVGLTSPRAVDAAKRSVEFCSLFCFPTGAFAGEIGARGTSIIYPAGLAVNSDTNIEAWFFERYLPQIGGVQPLTIDANNFVPLYNSWAHLVTTKKFAFEMPKTFGTFHLPKAGLYIKRTANIHIAISEQTGAVKSFFNPGAGWEELSVIAVSANEASSQCGSNTRMNIEGETATVKLTLGRKNEMLNSPLKSLVLRLIAALIYAVPPLQGIFKKILAYAVMAPKGAFRRDQPILKINLTDGSISATAQGISVRKRHYGFDRHMASANYYPQTHLDQHFQGTTQN